MKKLLLAGTALLSTVAATSQTKASMSPEMIGLLKNRYAVVSEKQTSVPGVNLSPKSGAKSSSTSVFSWDLISRSINFFGVLTTDQKVIQWDEELDAISSIQRKSPTYIESPPADPNAESGVIIAMITDDWGATWDSTAIWNRSDFWARYPQGAIYNPIGNTTLSNAYVVATGPVTTPAPQLWVGNFLVSKQLDVYTNTPGSNSLAQQVIIAEPNPDPVIGKVDFMRQDFSIGDNKVVRSMGGISTSANPSSGFKGGRILNGTFNAGGYFNWVSDSVMLDTNVVLFDGADFFTMQTSNMAWNEAGDVGYVWFISLRKNKADLTTGQLMDHEAGMQPVIYKTTNGGTNWVLQPAMNFNDTVKWAPLLNTLERVEGDDQSKRHLRIPFFHPFREDVAGLVDKNNELHLFSTVYSTKSSNLDSVFITESFDNPDGEEYHFAFEPGKMAYLYDFTLKSNGTWNMLTVDSMNTEGPSPTSGQPGFDENPWAEFEGAKQNANGRLQMSRSPNGEHILYSWSESDINFTNNGLRWNNRPDLHMRYRHADATQLHPVEYDITTGTNIDGTAFMHHVSPKSKFTTVSTSTLGLPTNSVNVVKDVTVTALTALAPVKVTKSESLAPDLTSDHYFTGASMTFTTEVVITRTVISVAEHTDFTSLNVYPNPTTDNAVLMMRGAKASSDVSVDILNNIGQVVSSVEVKANVGDNTVNLPVKGLAAGIYFVNIKSENGATTKKLVIQ